MYRALDANLNRQVALKLLPTEVTHDSGRRARFFREACAAAAVTHPNLATIYQVDQVGSQVFIAMELVEGHSLEAWLRGAPLPVNQALAMIRDVCAGVGCAHRAGIVHRDLKPANIMVSASGLLKVLDFGIAKLPPHDLVPTGPGSTELMPAVSIQPVSTQAGQILGTVGYMSPEQARGIAVDARSDVFSIGVILYEMLTGQRPFRGDSAVAVMLATAKDEPVPASRLNPSVGPALDQLLHACLSKHPAARPADALELLHRIESLGHSLDARLVAGMPATHPSAGSAQRGGAAMAVTPGTDAGAAGTVQLPGPTRPSRLRFVLLLGAAIVFGLAALGAGAAAALHWGPFAPELRSPLVGLEILHTYENPDDSRVSALDAPAWATATRDFRDAAAQPGAPSAWAARAEFARGQELMSLGRLEEAVSAFEQSQAIDPKFALPWLGLSAARLRQRKMSEALAAAQKAQLLAPKSWPAVTAAARAYAHDGKLDFAIQEYRRALAMAPNKPYLLSELALTYHAARMDEDAKRYATRALLLDPDVVPALILLSEQALEALDGQTALKHARRATAVEPRDVTAWLAQGDALLVLRQSDPARQALETAIRLWRETRQRGAPEERLKQVQVALDRGELPDPRTGPLPDSRLAAPDPSESSASASSLPPPRSVPRAKPAAKPGRSVPAPAAAPAPPPRAKPEQDELP